MNDEFKSDSPAVKAIIRDAELAAEVVSGCVQLSIGVLAHSVRELRAELEKALGDLRSLKLKMAGLEQENSRLQSQLKKRFGGIDSRLEQVEQRKVE